MSIRGWAVSDNNHFRILPLLLSKAVHFRFCRTVSRCLHKVQWYNSLCLPLRASDILQDAIHRAWTYLLPWDSNVNGPMHFFLYASAPLSYIDPLHLQGAISLALSSFSRQIRHTRYSFSEETRSGVGPVATLVTSCGSSVITTGFFLDNLNSWCALAFNSASHWGSGSPNTWAQKCVRCSKSPTYKPSSRQT